jgi:hypothetical protein
VSTFSASGGLFASTVRGLGTAGYISTASLTSTVAALGTPSALLVPYSTLNTASFFQLRTSSTQLYYGKVGSTSQVYVGDILAANGNSVNTNPLLLVEQEGIIIPTVTTTYTYVSAAYQNFTPPTGVTSINIILSGAGGGGGPDRPGGAGGYVSGTLAVTPNIQLTLLIGQGGAGAITSASGSATWGGGGSSTSFAAPGGGRTAIILSGNDLATAGGGGGGGNGSTGGAGGGTSGTAGSTAYGQPGGGGASGNTGGSGAAGIGGVGTQYTGGNGVSSGGGGGGGWYGGGGGYNGSGGGGGNALVTNLTGTVVNTQGGGAAGGTSGPSAYPGNPGTNGYITISYSVPPGSRPGNILEIRNYQANKTIIDPLLNMGINVTSINSSFQLDVNGALRAVSLSTQNIQLSSINGLTFGGPIISTVRGLGTAGYISTASFTSTVIGLGSAGYISTASLISSVAALGPASGILVPYSTLNTSSFFQLRTSSTQLYYGTVGSTAQVYMGDILAAAGNQTTSTPLLLMEQLPIINAPLVTNYTTPGTYSWTAPAGVTSITLVMRGGAGGGANLASGGNGGLVSGTLAVTPGVTYTIVSAGGGVAGGTGLGTGGTGGGGNGGSFGSSKASGGGGGSYFSNGATLLVAAGGGGGVGWNNSSTAGAGGGTTGANGTGNPGFGGTQSAGGAGNPNVAGDGAGSALQGGNGNASNSSGGGGGGGGYFGGGAGIGAGGGSSFVANLTGTVVNTQGGASNTGGSGNGGNGSVSITYPLANTSRPGNIVEIRNFQLNRIIIDPLLNMGINVSSINSSFQLDVNGSIRAQNMQLSSISGQDGIGNLAVNGSLIIPYSTLNTASFFQLRTSSTQIHYGTVGSNAQVYMGDILAASGNSVVSTPLLLMEQLPIYGSPVTVNYTSAGTSSWTAPSGITSITLTMSGAAGGGNNSARAGGSGGLVSGTLSVTPGVTYTLLVGGGGTLYNYPAIGTGGVGGGGNGSQYGSGGGGGSYFSNGATLLVAAGGGGGARQFNTSSAGNGGGTTGGSGQFSGTGGTQSAGGTGTTSPAQDGSFKQGGSGTDVNQNIGGGGGGYYGGGAGQGGGGGSSYVGLLTGTVVDTQGGGTAGTTLSGGAGSIAINYVPILNRPGNILEVRNYQSNKITIDPYLNMAINVVIPTSSFRLDVNGIGRMGMPVSSITGTVATFGTASYGIYYYISNSGFSNITLTSVTGFTGWFVTLRNNTTSYLSVAVTGQTNSTPATPFTIAPSNATTIAYDTNYNSGGTAGYAFF